MNQYEYYVQVDLDYFGHEVCCAHLGLHCPDCYRGVVGSRASGEFTDWKKFFGKLEDCLEFATEQSPYISLRSDLQWDLQVEAPGLYESVLAKIRKHNDLSAREN